ncbi:sema domain, transmembrane domain (TM), and cytoplasmic domain, (semaphorin) 6E isoform X1 [Hippocampus zosterae]|uniref:sema domain, transmembrane domain (TM), and cytoplasmic domain, (semaphorin) 6E isoform X1 n=1 Tax=Hippocampus zosterae TaxID=109293 RepID=UPI00223DA676|nr:sema domain, transmembrane domain (TM), and cytoplasmic domain, (semaphorin) 6E isoform X1 [Hippocampus zosterae]XP_051922428.1 sema domain, transmembrane domain (TM), and cytoplasmic domain, (semaphorin) 6E isoform X1 [Hippocampus zosterae]
MRRTPPPLHSPRSPPSPLPFLLLLLLLLGTAASMPPPPGGATPFPQDLEPISVVGRDSSYLFPSFQGLMEDNDTERLGLDFQRMLRINHMLYVAARDHVFAINLAMSSEQIFPQQKLTWKTKDVDKCTVRGKNSDECYNYIKVLVPRNDETLFACGTNAFNPTCRNYKMSTLEQDGEEMVGQARCPFESHQSNVGLFAGGDFYSATMTDFLASDAVIYRSLGESRPVLRTVKYDSKWLREPHFLHAIEYGNFVYFFFSEIAVEYTSLGKVVFSRVARVCKNDNGGSPRVLERYWTSFLKARLNCSVPGDSFFYFDVLQSLTNVLQINRRPAVLGVFTTQANSITGSAVCAFYMDDIEKAFSGKFKEQKNSEAAWTPVPDEQVPKPRPGCCAGEGSAADLKSSTAFPDEMLTFIKSYPLMDEAVPSANNRPLFTRTTSRFKLTQIAVDTSAGPNRNFTVIFLGSEDGRVLKVLTSTDGNNQTLSTTLLEDISVYNDNRCNVRGEARRVLAMELDRDHHALFVAFSGCVIRVPLSRCDDYSDCKTRCLSSRDPYCVWLKTGKCVATTPGIKSAFEQDVENAAPLHPNACHDILATTRKHNTPLDSSYGKAIPTSAGPSNHMEAGDPERGPGPEGPPYEGELGSPDSEPIIVEMEGVRRPSEADKSNHSVHYTLLIACVLVAFVLGAFLSGFLVSCYCNRTGHKTRKLSKDPEVQIPHALSLRSLAKLNGLLEGGAGKEDKLEASSPKIYSSLFSKEAPRRSAHHAMSMGDLVLPHHHHLRSSSELSGLPTPDSTPELPIKSMKAFRNQWEKNHNCNNASRPPSAHVFPYGASRHPDERKVHNAERLLPQHPGYAHKVMEVTSLDELLKHIHEGGGAKTPQLISPSGGHHTGGAAAAAGHLAYAGRVQPHIPETESAPYYSSSTLPRDSLTRRMDVPPDPPPPAPHTSTLERRQSSSQRHSLMGAGGGGGAALPRHHSFSQRMGVAHQPPPLLARMNSTGSCDGHFPLLPPGYLARYNAAQQEGPLRGGGGMRRGPPLKSDAPPKPLFIPASSPVSPHANFNY